MPLSYTLAFPPKKLRIALAYFIYRIANLCRTVNHIFKQTSFSEPSQNLFQLYHRHPVFSGTGVFCGTRGYYGRAFRGGTGSLRMPPMPCGADVGLF
ncbi:hypothetical protein KL86CLO1_10697 [uncultured Eubacteriales bacterium]|uniref:Uncharacterized protein n=1 Tax=uncultured Eubacteriales bacterium TaxID=172733 RepID=A0A212J8T0_9FIRM|nr:hypothetical protein KL86CLO1_10697 [uncultured Eubacteriales bacterium]